MKKAATPEKMTAARNRQDRTAKRWTQLIRADRCAEIGYPLPKPWQDQASYVLAAMMDGYEVNTRNACYIGIANLHSVAAALRKKWTFTTEYRLAFCPERGVVPPFSVDHLFITPEQRRINLDLMPRKPSE